MDTREGPISSNGKGESLGDIIRYYDQTVLDYRVLWLNGTNRAIHFGYHDPADLSHAQALLRLNEKLAELGEISSGDRVLDAGCGVGGSSFWMAEQRGARVTGITPVQSQVDKARRLSARRRLDHVVAFERADYRQTPFADESFEVVWACESVCHAPQKYDFYREAFRLLRPGGRLVMAEYLRRQRPLAGEGEDTLRRWLSGWAIEDIDTPEEHVHHLQRAGFSRWELRDVTTYVEPSLRRLHRMSARLYRLAIFLNNSGMRTDTQHGNVVGAVTQYEALKADFWQYYLIKAVKAE